jgi:putative phosphoesterase
VRFLVIGDSHIPDRAQALPCEIQQKITQLSQMSPFDGVFCTGDLTAEQPFFGLLSDWAGTGFLKIVQGNMDAEEGIENPVFDSYAIPEIDIEVGLYHGTLIKPRGDRGQTEKFAMQRNVNILITGHSHAQDVFLAPSGTLLLNPGSCVGAWSFVATGIPSFILLETGEKIIDVRLYELRLTELREQQYHYNINGKKLLV